MKNKVLFLTVTVMMTLVTFSSCQKQCGPGTVDDGYGRCVPINGNGGGNGNYNYSVYLSSYTFAIVTTSSTSGPAYKNDGNGRAQTNGTGNFLGNSVNTGYRTMSGQVWNGSSFETRTLMVNNSQVNAFGLSSSVTNFCDGIANWFSGSSGNLQQNGDQTMYIAVLKYNGSCMGGTGYNSSDGTLNGECIQFEIDHFEAKRVRDVFSW